MNAHDVATIVILTPLALLLAYWLVTVLDWLSEKVG